MDNRKELDNDAADRQLDMTGNGSLSLRESSPVNVQEQSTTHVPGFFDADNPVYAAQNEAYDPEYAAQNEAIDPEYAAQNEAFDLEYTAQNEAEKPEYTDTYESEYTRGLAGEASPEARLDEAQKDTAVKELNAVLKGEYMAVQSYDKFIKAADNKEIKNAFMDMQLDHKRHIGQLEKRIISLGGEPETNTGMAGTMSNIMMSIKTRMADSVDILKKAYDGEDKGIAKAEKIVEGDLDEESRKLVEDILLQDHEHLKKMANIIQQYEN